MPGTAYDPATKLQVHVVSRSPHTFAHKLWVARPGETRWSEVGKGNIETGMKEYGPFPGGTKLAYALLIGGNPGTDWKMQVILSQGGNVLSCSPAPETGITSARGAARRDTAVVLQ